MSDNVWGQWYQARWHRLDGISHGDQVVACGRRVMVSGVYHCCPEAGPDAVPVVGEVCEECRHRAVKARPRERLLRGTGGPWLTFDRS